MYLPGAPEPPAFPSTLSQTIPFTKLECTLPSSGQMCMVTFPGWRLWSSHMMRSSPEGPGPNTDHSDYYFSIDNL